MLSTTEPCARLDHRPTHTFLYCARASTKQERKRKRSHHGSERDDPANRSQKKSEKLGRGVSSENRRQRASLLLQSALQFEEVTLSFESALFTRFLAGSTSRATAATTGSTELRRRRPRKWTRGFATGGTLRSLPTILRSD